MKKYLLIILLIPTLSLGQKSSLSQSFDIAFPHGSFSSSAGTGWGTSFRYQYSISRRAAGLGTIGFVSFGKKSYSSATPPIYTISTKSRMIPIQVGMKYYLTLQKDAPQSGLFVSGEAGVHIVTGEASINGVENKIPDETDFSYAPGVGYQIGRFEFNYREHFVTSSGKTISYSSIRIAWIFYGRAPK